jgi:excisionase family DNA binding protein
VRKFNLRPVSVVEGAALLHMEFVNIHPFVDGNGRLARLLLNLYLMRNGYPPIIIRKVDRKSYMSAIRTSQSKGDHYPFIHLIARYTEQALDLWLDSVSEGQGDHISLKEASRSSRYSQEYLSLLVRSGRLPGMKFGRNWKVRKEDVVRYEKEHNEE